MKIKSILWIFFQRMFKWKSNNQRKSTTSSAIALSMNLMVLMSVLFFHDHWLKKRVGFNLLFFHFIYNNYLNFSHFSHKYNFHRCPDWHRFSYSVPNENAIFSFQFLCITQNASKWNLLPLLCQSKQYPATISLQSILFIFFFKYKIEMEMKINIALLHQCEWMSLCTVQQPR